MSYLGRSPTGSILTGADIADGSISTSKIADNAIVTGKITDGTIATGDIADSAVTAVKTSGVGITSAEQWRLTSSFTGNAIPIASNLERTDSTKSGSVGTSITESSGVFTLPTGIWKIEFIPEIYGAGGDDAQVNCVIDVDETNNGSFTGYATGLIALVNNSWTTGYISCFVDVTDSNVKVRFAISGSAGEVGGSSTVVNTHFNFIRLGDT